MEQEPRGCEAMGFLLNRRKLPLVSIASLGDQSSVALPNSRRGV